MSRCTGHFNMTWPYVTWRERHTPRDPERQTKENNLFLVFDQKQHPHWEEWLLCLVRVALS